MDDRLPLFPLGTVLFPGIVLPLHIFEERYRLMVRDLLETPEPRRFGVVAIELGHEVGMGAAKRLVDVGCTGVVHGITSHEDGRFDLVAVGADRFRVKRVDDSLPYLRADTTPLPENEGSDPERSALMVHRLFRVYRNRLAKAGADVVKVAEPMELPEDPVRLSYLIAAALVLDRDEKQQLLETEDATARLQAETDLLIRENRLLAALPTVPVSQFIEGSAHPN